MRTYTELFAVAEFRALFGARLATMAAVSVASLAMGAIVYDSTGSPLLTALSMFGAPLISVIGASTILGVSDTVGPRAAMLVVTGIQGLQVLVQALPGLPVWVRFAAIAAAALASSAFGGSVMRMLTEIVPADGLVLGRSTLNLAVGGMQIAGYGLGGLLLTRISPTGLFLVAAAGLGLSAVILRLGLRERPPTQTRTKVVARTRSVNRHLLGSRVTGPIYACLWIPNGLVVGVEALFVPFVGASGAGYLFAVTAAGMLLGDVLVGRVIPHRLRDRLIIPLRLLLGLPYLAMVLQPPLPVVLALGFVSALGYCASTLLQERLVWHTDPAVKGQVFGLAGTGLMVGQAAGAAVAGLAATWLPVGLCMALLAAASVLTTALVAGPLRRSQPLAG